MSASPAPLRQRSRLPHHGRLGRAVRLISLLDRRSMRRLQNRHLPRWAQLWMLFASRFGGAFLWICVALLVEWQGGPRRYLALSASLGACFFGLVLLLGIKPFTRRQRPHPYRRPWAPARDPDRFSFPAGLTIRWLPTEDDFQPKPAVFFQQGIAFARTAMDSPGQVLYVHCTAGVHRGPLAALAILMDRGMSLEAARGLIRARRPVVNFPEVYLDSLREYMLLATPA